MYAGVGYRAKVHFCSAALGIAAALVIGIPIGLFDWVPQVVARLFNR